jgi:fibronectin-binding autotransporter adhesin
MLVQWVNASNVNSNNSDLILAGRLQISNGTMNIGPSTSPNHNDLEYAATELPELIVEGNGILNVNGQIRRSVNVLLGSLTYIQRNNSTVLVRGKNPDGAGTFNLNRAKFEILNPGSSFTMQDNALLIIDRTGQPSGIFGDFYLDPQITTVSGGEIRFGTALTPASQTFLINSSAALWNVSVDGTSTAKTVQLLNNPITIQRNLAIEGLSVFNASGYDVNIGGNLTNNNTNATKGTSTSMFGGYRAGSTAGQIASQVTTFNGSTAQTITGVSGNLTNFGNLVVNNSNPGGLTLAANSNIAVIGYLNVQSGNINGGTNNISVDGNIESSSSISNSGAGFFICGSSTSSIQSINGNGNGSFGNFRVNNPAGINMIAPFTINGIMNFASGIFYINNHQLSFGESASVTGSLSASSMIRMNGVTSDGGVRKFFPASAQSFTFPVGITLKYTPSTIQVTSNTVAGSVTLKPVNTRHPATTDVLDKELTYYWNTTSTGFNASTTVTHTYSYLQSDAINGNENLYVAGRYVNNVWSPQFGIPSTVNATTNTITLSGVNYFNGDYTAGESSEFDQLLIFYSRNATNGGNWNDPNSWSTDQILQHAGPAAGTAPSFNSVVIAAGHTITATTNSLNAPTAQLNGTLNIQNFNGHNFGTVTGTGRLLITPNVSNQFIFPGGNFSAFISAGGGTVEYQNNSLAALLPTQATYNNLAFSGSGVKHLPNVNLLVNGNLDIQAGVLINVSNRNLNLKGNFTNTPGVPGFQQGTGTLSLTGATQSISGATQFYRLTINGAGVKNAKQFN